MSTPSGTTAAPRSQQVKVAQTVSFENGTLRLDQLREHSASELMQVLEMHQGSKLLMISSEIGDALSQTLTNATTLFQSLGVQHVKELSTVIATKDSVAPFSDVDKAIFLVRPLVSHMRLVAANVHALLENNPNLQTHLLFAPYKTLICEKVLEDEGLLKHLHISELNIGLIPTEMDVLTMDLGAAFRESALEGDYTCVEGISKSILLLENLFGIIPNVKALGPLSRLVATKITKSRMEQANLSGGDVDSLGEMSSSIDSLVLIDREIDLVTPLLTPLTYEGLVDELIGVRNSGIKVEKRVTGEEEDPAQPGLAEQKVRVVLNSNDKLFQELRNLNIEAVGPLLGSKAKDVRGQYDKFRANKDATITQIHDFVKQIPGLKDSYQLLNQHINITEIIKKTTDGLPFRSQWQSERAMLEGDTCFDLIEEMIHTREPLLKVLRLLCLQSITAGGIRSNKYDYLKREIVQTYGFELLFTLSNLEKCGLLKKREMQLLDSGSQFGTVRRALALIDDAVDVISPTDISYVSSGYAPMSVRWVQCAIQPGWSSYYQILSTITKHVLQFTQQLTPLDLASLVKQWSPAPNLPPSRPNVAKKTMLVYFVGGVTYMEIASLRLLSRLPDFPFEIVVCTTKIINGNTFLQGLVHDLEAQGED